MENINEANTIVNQEVLVDKIDKILTKSSIARRVSDVQRLKGPIGIITGAQWTYTDATVGGTKGGKLEIASGNIEAFTRKIITEFTEETLQDLQGIYGEDLHDMLAHYISDELIYMIDKDFISMVKTRAGVVKDSLVFGASYDNDLFSVGQSIVISAIKGLSDLPISDNRSPNGWAIVSSNIASVLATATNVTENVKGSGELENDGSPSYLGKIAGLDIYVDFTHPNDGIDSVIFGIKGNGYSKGSTTFSPYTKEWVEVTNPSDGQKNYILFDRTAMAINPLDDKYWNAGAGTSAFLGKINVDLSGMQNFN